ncbi:hypothetical protein JZ751_024845, partial [Albula glossodonta]
MYSNTCTDGTDGPEDPFGPSRPATQNGSQQRHIKCYILGILAVVATAGISSGIPLYICHQFSSPQDNNPIRAWTYKLTNNGSKSKTEYEIFTVQKDGDYFIVGEVWKTEEQHCGTNNHVWLRKELRSEEIIAQATFCESGKVTFAEKLWKMRKNAKIYGQDTLWAKEEEELHRFCVPNRKPLHGKPIRVVPYMTVTRAKTEDGFESSAIESVE